MLVPILNFATGALLVVFAVQARRSCEDSKEISGGSRASTWEAETRIMMPILCVDSGGEAQVIGGWKLIERRCPMAELVTASDC